MRAIRLLGALCACLAVASTHAVEGDAERGKLLYAQCGACHGVDGKGNEALNAPNLTGLQAWYLVRQLSNFSAGIRGGSRDDVWGQTMVATSMMLKDDQDRADVAAYIGTLADQ